MWHTAPVTEQIRPATPADVDAITAMAGARRRQYSTYQPVFWAPSPDADEVHKPYLAAQIADENVISLVSEDSGKVTGFVIASLTGAPPVYRPGGRTCQIDDFVVMAGSWNSSGARLLMAAIELAVHRGAIQAVVVTGHLDEEKRAALRACGLSIASEWWVTPALRPADVP